MVVLEESGRAALHRRLGALARGGAIRPDELRDLHFAANRRVRLDDVLWQADLLEAVERIAPVAVFFDPLARLKAPGRNENAQDEMSVLLDFMRQLRDEAPRPCAVTFVHHSGHEGTHLRGSSDLESYWESKVTLKRDGEEASFSAEHREAEASDTYKFRQAWDYTTRSLRLRLLDDKRREEVQAKVDAHLRKHPDDSANKTFEAVGGNRGEVLEAVAKYRGEQVVPRSLVPASTTPPGSLAGGTETGAHTPVGGVPLRVPPRSKWY